MTKGKATATISGRTVAETDEYEVVEGNIYVCTTSYFYFFARPPSMAPE